MDGRTVFDIRIHIGGRATYGAGCVEWDSSTMEARNFDGLSCSLGAHEEAAQPGIVLVRPSRSFTSESSTGQMGDLELKSTVHTVSVMCRLGSLPLGSGFGLVARCSEMEMRFLLHDGGNELPAA